LGAGLIFKGTGFYETDYKKKSGGEPKESPSSTDSGSSDKSSSPKKETKKESKPKKAKAA